MDRGGEVTVGNLGGDGLRPNVQPTLRPRVAGRLSARGGDERGTPLHRVECARDLRFQPVTRRDDAVPRHGVVVQLTVLEVPVAAPESDRGPLGHSGISGASSATTTSGSPESSSRKSAQAWRVR